MTRETTDGAVKDTFALANSETATPEVINRPRHDYDPRWALYNEQNPHRLRSVGADTPDEGGGGDDGGGDDKGAEDGGDKGGEEAQAAADAAAAAEKPGHFSDSYTDPAVKAIAARYNSEADMATALKEANVKLSKSVVPLGDKATPEEIAKYNKSIGVPETLEGYNLKKPEHMDQEIYDSEGMQAVVKGIAGAMHEAGATPAVVNAAMGTYWAMEAAAEAQAVANDAELEAETDAGLRKEWGKGYDSNMAFVAMAAAKYPDLANLVLKNDSLVGNSPFFAKVLSTIGRYEAEGMPQVGIVNTEQGVDIKAEYDRLTEEIHKAHSRGDKAATSRLDAERKPLGEKLFGTGPIGGAGLQ